MVSNITPSTRRDHHHEPEPPGSLERASRHIVDLALCGAVFLVPCCLGGRIALGHFVLACCATIAACGWSMNLFVARRPTWTVSWVEPLLLAILGVGLLQITPLPAELLQLLSPHQRELLPIWSAAAEGAGTLGEWKTLSLHVAESRGALITGLSYVLLFYVGVQRLRRIDDVERLMKWIACAASGMALFGVLQWLSNNGKFFWFYDYPLTDTHHRLKGAFTNRNHFAQFLAMGCGPMLWWVLSVLDQRLAAGSRFGNSKSSRGPSDTLLAMLLLMLGILVFAVLFSLSRGGTIALGVSLLVMLLGLYRCGALSGRLAAALLGISGVAGTLFLMFGFEKFSNRLDHWQSDSRLAIWQANAQIIADFPLFGTGVGSHVEAYPLYFDAPHQVAEFTHAENSYLQVASEAGLIGLGVALLCWACCAKWCLRGMQGTGERRLQVLFAAICSSLSANAVHAVFDFVWYVPGLMTTLLLLMASLRRLNQWSMTPNAPGTKSGQRGHNIPAEDRSMRPVPRWLGLVTAAAAVLAATWSWPILLQSLRGEPHWFDYLRITLQQDESDAADSATGQSDDAQTAAAREMDRFKLRVTALNQATNLNPSHARSHLRLASAYLRAFEHLQERGENPMTLSQLKDTAQSSQFKSVAAMREWLQRAIGSNLKYLDAAQRHARLAVQLCPLQGTAYLHLSELQFLDDLDPAPAKALLQQAQLVRPHSAQVQFVVGREALLDGDLDSALKQWKSAFHQDRGSRSQILNLLVGTAPAQAILESLEPDLEALEELEIRYRDLMNDDYAVVARAYAEALKSQHERIEGEAPAERLLKAAAVYARLQDLPAADLAFRGAIEAEGSSFVAHRDYGLFLYQNQEFARSVEQLKWCLRIKPSDESLQRLTQDAIQRSLKGDSPILPATGLDILNRRRRRL